MYSSTAQKLLFNREFVSNLEHVPKKDSDLARKECRRRDQWHKGLVLTWHLINPSLLSVKQTFMHVAGLQGHKLQDMEQMLYFKNPC